MNDFRICADFIHLLAFLLLIRKIIVKQSCAGVSGKSQILIATVFTFRYLDLLTIYISLYNTLFKISYIVLAYVTLYLIFCKFHKTYDSKNDSFWAIFIILAAFVLTFCLNYMTLHRTDGIEVYRRYLNNPLELAWTFSIYLEALAIIPQLCMISKTGDGSTVLHYIVALTVYRGLYVCNWIYRYFVGNYLEIISLVSGTVQTLLLVIVLICIQVYKNRKPKWQEITEVFTVESARFGGPTKIQPPSFCVTPSQKEDAKHLLHEKI